MKKADDFSIVAKASKSNKATTGRILIKSKNYKRSIPAVIFEPDEASDILRIIDKVTSE